MEPKMKRKKMARKHPVYGLWIVLLLAMITLNCAGNKFASDDLIGTWKATDIKYSGTFFKIDKKAITFRTKEGDTSSYAIIKVKKEPLQDPEWVQVTIFYRDRDRPKVEFPFYFHSKGRPIIRFKNQTHLTWENINSRVDSPHNKNAESFLFVCSGNDCLSPIAEGFAKKLAGKNTRIESAGLTPTTRGATPEAIWVLMDMHDIDISHHKARNVADLQLDTFDRIIVLEASVLEVLQTRYPLKSDRFTLWDIQKQQGKGTEAIRKAAEVIKKTIERNLLPDCLK
jgi:protein-tyrosine phosphatase